MAATLAVSTGAQAIIGAQADVTGAGWGVAAVTITVSHPDSAIGLSVTVTPSSGNITTVGVVKMNLQAPGVYTFTATDGTSTVTSTVQVFED